jgi:hypothetical protein
MKGEGYNVVPDVVGVDQPFTQGILEGTVRTIGYQNTDTHPRERGSKVKLAVALDALNSPGAIILSGPLEILQGSYGAVFLSSLTMSVEVYRSQSSILNPLASSSSCEVLQVNGVVVDHGGRIGRVLGLDDDLLFGWLDWLSGQCVNAVDNITNRQSVEDADGNHNRFLLSVDYNWRLVFLPV